MMNQETFQSTPNKPQTITFPEGKPILAEANTSKQLAAILAKSPDLQLLYDSVAPVKNVKAAVEMVVYSLNYLSKINGITPMQNIMAGLFTYYKYEEFIGNELLHKYTIIKKSENIYTYKIRRESYDCNFKPKKIDNLDYKKNKFLEIQSTYHAIYAAIKNGNKQTVEELIKEVLKNADLYLTVFSASNYNKYDECTTIIAAVIELLEPESKIHAYRTLKKHWQQHFDILTNFSNALLLGEHFDEIIELLESKLANIATLANEDIGSCYYNLGLAYYSKTNYQAAKKYYLSALKHLPNDQDTILELIKIFLNTSEIKSAANYIKNLESKDIKNLLEMGLDLSTISITKFNLVKNKPVPESLVSLIPIFEYIAKFNEGKLSNKDKAFKVLCKKCNNNPSLLSTVIYTKQYNFIKEIVQKISKEELFQNKHLWKFKALFGLEEDTETSQMVIDNNNLEGREAADLINISNTVSIAKGEFDSVAEKVDNALKYDQKNEEALEIGIAASLLNNNQEKAREYADQLSEEKQQEISTNYSRGNKAESIGELIEQYDPKEIHAYYQRVKQQKFFEISRKFTNNQVDPSWNIDKKIIKKDDTFFVGKYKGLNCFAKIAKEEVEKKLDNNLIDSFTRAIEKGITYCKTGINGVKFLQNKAVELKIDGDMRLFTNLLYKNSQEELLINFDHYGNHDEAGNFANNHKLIEVLGDLTVL